MKVYSKISIACRKCLEDKKFRTILNTLLASIVLFAGTVFQSDEVFGQAELMSEIPTLPPVVVTEEVVLTTKRASHFPVVGPLSQGFTNYHPGIDIEASFGSLIYPFLQGIIAEAGYSNNGYGNYVLIDHRNGYFSLYAHLNSIFVKQDEEVIQEVAVGTVGLTGNTTGSHLHLEIYENGSAINPLTILPESSFATDSARAAYYGGPQALATRILMRPISEQGQAIVSESINEAESEDISDRTVSDAKRVDIWLPDPLTMTTLQTSEDVSGSAKSHLLPTLVQF